MSSNEHLSKLLIDSSPDALSESAPTSPCISLWHHRGTLTPDGYSSPVMCEVPRQSFQRLPSIGATSGEIRAIRRHGRMSNDANTRGKNVFGERSVEALHKCCVITLMSTVRVLPRDNSRVCLFIVFSGAGRHGEARQRL